jgi:hypothetical protein
MEWPRTYVLALTHGKSTANRSRPHHADLTCERRLATLPIHDSSSHLDNPKQGAA